MTELQNMPEQMPMIEIKKPEKGSKQAIVDALIAFMLHEYALKALCQPTVLMWRELRNDYHISKNKDFDSWKRDDKFTHGDWKKYGPSVVKILLRDERIVAVKVSSAIRMKLSHREIANRSKALDDKFYKSCLPAPHAEVRGMVIFPANVSPDHPLLVHSSTQRLGRGANGVVNASTDLDVRNGLGVITDDTRNEIRGYELPKIGRVLEIEDPIPLITLANKKALE